MYINYHFYVELLIDMMFINDNNFSKEANNIAKELYKRGGSNALFKCMDYFIMN